MQEWNDLERWNGFIIRFKLLPLIIIVVVLTILLILLTIQENKKERSNTRKYIIYFLGAISGVITIVIYLLSFLFIPYAGL